MDKKQLNQKSMIKGKVADSYFSNQKYVNYFSVKKNDRTHLRRHIEENWANYLDSEISVIGPVSIDWLTRQIQINSLDLSRKDIYVIDLWFWRSNDRHNIFVEPDLTYNVDSWNVTNPSLLNDTSQLLQDYIDYYLTYTDYEYITRQQRWFAQQPYQEISGKTPEEAVKILKSLGW